MKISDVLSSWKVLRKGTPREDAAMGAWDDGIDNGIKFVSYTGEPPVDKIPRDKASAAEMIKAVDHGIPAGAGAEAAWIADRTAHYMPVTPSDNAELAEHWARQDWDRAQEMGVALDSRASASDTLDALYLGPVQASDEDLLAGMDWDGPREGPDIVQGLDEALREPDSWDAHTAYFEAPDRSQERADSWLAVGVDPLKDGGAPYVEPAGRLITDGGAYLANHPSAAWLESTWQVDEYERDEGAAWAEQAARENQSAADDAAESYAANLAAVGEENIDLLADPYAPLGHDADEEDRADEPGAVEPGPSIEELNFDGLEAAVADSEEADDLEAAEQGYGSAPMSTFPATNEESDLVTVNEVLSEEESAEVLRGWAEEDDPTGSASEAGQESQADKGEGTPWHLGADDWASWCDTNARSGDLADEQVEETSAMYGLQDEGPVDCDDDVAGL